LLIKSSYTIVQVHHMQCLSSSSADSLDNYSQLSVNSSCSSVQTWNLSFLTRRSNSVSLIILFYPFQKSRKDYAFRDSNDWNIPCPYHWLSDHLKIWKRFLLRIWNNLFLFLLHLFEVILLNENLSKSEKNFCDDEILHMLQVHEFLCAV
jgi:hypothetical protein